MTLAPAQAKGRKLLFAVRRDQLQQHLGVEGLDEAVVVPGSLGEDSAPFLGVLPALIGRWGEAPGCYGRPNQCGDVPLLR
jgi:hypothetical protein